MLENASPLYEIFCLKTKAGQWAFQVWRDGVEIGGGVGYEDEFEAFETAQEIFPEAAACPMIVMKSSGNTDTVLYRALREPRK